MGPSNSRGSIAQIQGLALAISSDSGTVRLLRGTFAAPFDEVGGPARDGPHSVVCGIRSTLPNVFRVRTLTSGLQTIIIRGYKAESVTRRASVSQGDVPDFRLGFLGTRTADLGHSRTGQKESTMAEIKDRSSKKKYNAPELTSHGDIDEVTQKGGETTTDVPIGTPVDGDISNVAS